MERIDADVIVAGAGPAGSCFAWRMALAGFRVVVLEAQALGELGRAIEVFHMDCRAFGELGLPEPLPPELIHREPGYVMWSPDRSIRETVDYPFFVMNMPLFLSRLQGYAREAGVTFLDRREVTDLAPGPAGAGSRGEDRAEPVIACVKGRGPDGAFEARARLFVDASGMAGALRTRLPAEAGLETAPIDPSCAYSCCLEFRADTGPGSLTGSNSFIAHKGFWNRSYGDDVIIGLSSPAGYEETWKRHAAFREEYFGDPGRVVARRQGRVPLRRSLLSLVADGFLVVGDAAFQNRPFSGEGVVSGMTAATMAARVAASALASGKASREALWPYNIEYFRDQGAKFAAMFAQLPAAAELSRPDIDWLFHKRVIFRGDDFREISEGYENRMGPARSLRMVAILVAGALSGRLGHAAFLRLVSAARRSSKIRAHYLRYPASPAGFPAWESSALSLWGERGKA